MKYLVLLTGCLLAAASIAQQATTSPSRATGGSFQVTGRVVNALTGEPVAGASVSLSQAIDLTTVGARNRVGEPPRRAETPDAVSGPDGSFAFANLKAGKYSLRASRRGFALQAFEEHEQYSTAIVVGPGKESTGIVFRLHPDASISGHLIDDHNEAVANAQVMLFREGMENGKRGVYRAVQVPSSDEGYYHFPHLRPGKFFVAVSATPWYAQYFGARQRMMNNGDAAFAPASGNAALDMSFPLTFYPGVTDPERAESIDLKPGQRENADFTLMAVPALHLRVTTPVNDQQQPAMTAVMQEIFDSEIAVRGSTMNVGPGVTEISGLTPGHYVLQVRSGGGNRAPQMVGQREIDVAGDMEVNADAAPGATISGVIRFDGPAPSDPARIMIRRRTRPAAMLEVNEKGEFGSEQSIQPGNYDIFLPVPGYQITRVSATGAKLKGQTIQVGSDNVVLKLVATKSSARVEGFVLTDGKPAAGAMVVLVPEDMDRALMFRRDQSDSDGSFALANVTPGKYTLIALANGWDLEWGKPEVLKPYLAAGIAVQVAADGKYQLDPPLQ